MKWMQEAEIPLSPEHAVESLLARAQAVRAGQCGSGPTVYEYDEDSQLVAVTDAQQNTTTLTYNQPGGVGYTNAKRYLIKEVQRPSVTVPSAVTYAPTRYV